jgi:hypothetical protein
MKLHESISVELGQGDYLDSIMITPHNLEPEAIGAYGGRDKDRYIVDSIYKNNIDAITRVMEALDHLRRFCEYRNRGFSSRLTGQCNAAMKYERMADDEYKQLPIELKW